MCEERERNRERESVRVCECVCERERQRERDIGLVLHPIFFCRNLVKEACKNFALLLRACLAARVGGWQSSWRVRVGWSGQKSKQVDLLRVVVVVVVVIAMVYYKFVSLM